MSSESATMEDFIYNGRIIGFFTLVYCIPGLIIIVALLRSEIKYYDFNAKPFTILFVNTLAADFVNVLLFILYAAPCDLLTVKVFNLGTGHGYSVLQMIKALEKACGKEIPYKIEGRRPGDIATVFCDTTKATQEMGWKSELGLDEMCCDLWKWQSLNPQGFSV